MADTQSFHNLYIIILRYVQRPLIALSKLLADTNHNIERNYMPSYSCPEFHFDVIITTYSLIHNVNIFPLIFISYFV